MNRRDFCLVTGSAFASLALGSSCTDTIASKFAREGRLISRPHEGVKTTTTGFSAFSFPNSREALVYVPKRASESAVPLLLMLHGATQNPQRMFDYLGETPEDAGVAVLAPKSRNTTWDAMGGSFGEDVDFLNVALDRVFSMTAIDPARISIGGFSDGASYAISLGLINGDLFVASPHSHQASWLMARPTANRASSFHTALRITFCRSTGAAGASQRA